MGVAQVKSHVASISNREEETESILGNQHHEMYRRDNFEDACAYAVYFPSYFATTDVLQAIES